MHLVVGLGNPGTEYDGTRHNVGFAVIDRLAAEGATEPFRASKRALVAKATLERCPVLLVKPQTFMNLSGESVGVLARYFRVPTESILVVHDELDFPPGQVRLKPGGGHGGHNGLRNLLVHLEGDFARVRLGIGKPRARGPGQAVGFVLGRLAGAERDAIEAGIDEAVAAVHAVLAHGLEAAMGRVNRAAPAKL
jgi:PTH1 family peptidyl-tRNA hydrolase